MLFKISKALNHDFFNDCSNLLFSDEDGMLPKSPHLLKKPPPKMFGNRKIKGQNIFY